MKTPILMLEDILAQVSEGINTLSSICRELPDDEKADSAFACLIRSFDKTLAEGYDYIRTSAPTKVKLNDIANDIFQAAVTAEKLRELSHTYTENYFIREDDSDPSCIMASVIYDYAIKIDRELKNIEGKCGGSVDE